MKVTANIREYIKAEVAKIFDIKVNPYAEQAEADKLMIEAFGEHLRATQQAMIDQFITDNNLLEYSHWYKEVRPCTIKAASGSFSSAVTPVMVEAQKWDNELAISKASKTREIIAKLELGANRQELDAMLAELLNEN